MKFFVATLLAICAIYTVRGMTDGWNSTSFSHSRKASDRRDSAEAQKIFEWIGKEKKNSRDTAEPIGRVTDSNGNVQPVTIQRSQPRQRLNRAAGYYSPPVDRQINYRRTPST